MQKYLIWAGLSLTAVLAYLQRRTLLAFLLKLPAPRYGVRVRRDIPISMPDGVRLYADLYSPDQTGDYPTILIRTPYGRGKELPLGGSIALSDLPARVFAERGYHVLVQGARGCLGSEGEFSPHVHEAEDGQSTLAWMKDQPWYNGILGTWGPSYLGYMQWAMAAQGHEGIQAMVPMITSSENYNVTYPDDAFGLETRLRWCQGMVLQERSRGRSAWQVLRERLSSSAEEQLQAAFNHLPFLEADVVACGEAIPFYRALLTHPDRRDPFWTARDHSQTVSQIDAAVHLVGGWYDYYLAGTLRDYESLLAGGRQPYLTIGPWHHAHPQGLLRGLREGLAWFECHLRGDLRRCRQKAVRIYVMGANAWRDLDAFPPATQTIVYHLHENGRLSQGPASANSFPDQYVYDPSDPTPAVGGALLSARNGGRKDNRVLEDRTDILTYTTAPLARPLEIIGPVELHLYIHSDRSHTDFYGRLCDVMPDGSSFNICEGLLRLMPGRGDVQADGSIGITIDLGTTAYHFKKGHRIRLMVASGAHPHWSRNPGTGEPLAAATSLVRAHQTIFHDLAHPSAVILPVIGPGDGHSSN